ncbi:hypothetical protein SAMN05421739_11152 [Pontibacter chinhatensis]|uniref:Uncharacterized protein n=1 Tax=Pontibacter chinhatensis TaxID=1436961 RepID=A0A1I2Z3M8_9BACT|nr:hypothetical protein SAMN05421739_11152 [Pontibacter chinhatensis]
MVAMFKMPDCNWSVRSIGEFLIRAQINKSADPEKERIEQVYREVFELAADN